MTDSVATRPARVVPVDLAGLAAALGLQAPSAEATVTGVTSSSVDVRPGDLFAALPGQTEHGARFVGDAVAEGAAAVLTDVAGAAMSRSAGVEVPLLVVDEPRAVLGAVAAEVYGHPARALTLYGITGTSGKTTTSFLVRAGLRAAGLSTGLVGTVGVFVGDEVVKTPFTTPEAPQLQALLALMVERGVRVAGMEVSSHALRMGRVDAVGFAVGAFLNLSQDHLDFHSDMEDYFQAKSLLFDGRARREVVVVDDEWGRRLVTPETVTVSLSDPRTTWHARDVSVQSDGSTRFTVTGPGVSFASGCRIPGSYNIGNTLVAFAVLAELGVDPVSVAGAVADAQVPGRMERVDAGQPFLAVVDYSHKPAGVSGALRALRPLTGGSLIIVLGCGGDRDRGKRPVMGEVAAREADVLIVTDDNPRSEDPAMIRAAMLAGAARVPVAESARVIEHGDRGGAIAEAVALARPGDTVLIAGKGHETGQQVGASMLAFDDVDVLRQALRAAGFDAAGEWSAHPPTGSRSVTSP